MSGESTGREAILAIMRSAPEHLDEIYSSGYSNLTYLDVEQRRLAQAADLLDLSLRLTVERDLPVCRVWQLGSRARLHMLTGNWDDAVADAGQVLDERGAQLARPWPLLVRGLVALRRTAGGADDIGEAWRLARRYGESLRTFPAAAAIAERAWLTGTPDDRLDDCRRLLGGPELPGLQWARGELAMWLHRCGVATEVGDVAEPYRRYLDGDAAAAAEEFERLGVQYEAALALTETTATGPVRRGLDMLDRLGAAAVADKVRLDLRVGGSDRGTRTPTDLQPVESGRTDVAPDRGAAPDGRRTDQRRTGRAALPVGQDGRPPRVGDPGEAERAQPQGGGAPGTDAGDHRRRSCRTSEQDPEEGLRLLRPGVLPICGAVCSSTNSAISSVIRPGASSIGMCPTPSSR